jgi:phosphatidylglycerophosphate synthase
MLRLMAIILAMITDSIDGYLARRSKTTSRLGAVLDPAMDKFFVFFALTVLFLENKIELWQLLMMISRDFALCLFGLYLSLSGLWQTYEFRSIRWGKVTTALQFIVLIGVSLGYQIPSYLFYSFIAFATFGLYELFQIKRLSSNF